MMPLKTAIREYFQRTDGEAQEWLNDIAQEAEASMELQRKFMQSKRKILIIVALRMVLA